MKQDDYIRLFKLGMSRDIKEDLRPLTDRYCEGEETPDSIAGILADLPGPRAALLAFGLAEWLDGSEVLKIEASLAKLVDAKPRPSSLPGKS